ncbi:MAG: hypothetical protein WCK09_03940 [Bacteroidota bacterium]
MCFGVMCSGMVFQHWQAEALNELKKHGHRLVLLIMDERKAPETSRIKRLLRKKWKTFLFSLLDNRIFKPDAKRAVDMKPDLQGIEIRRCSITQKGYSEYFGDDDVAAIREYKLDFILRFGFNIIRGDILTAARFGVWSFHHDDEMRYRGGPPGFWEIYQGNPVSGAMMQRLTDKLDGGVILKKGYLKTIMHSYKENLNQLLSVSSAWPAHVADELSETIDTADITADPPPGKTSNTPAPIYKVPGNGQMIKFLWLLLRNRIRFYYHDLIAAEIWNVGIITKPIREVATGNAGISESEITWLAPVSLSGYLADPAGFIEDGRLHILAEDYSYDSLKAGIVEIDPYDVDDHVRVMEGTLHMSYPFVFEHDHVVYCLPECYQSSQITLYRRDSVSRKFIRERTLLDNVQAVDPTLFFHDGLWWLFFTDRKYSNTHLYLYHAQELSGEFKPHRLNPVKTDIRSARPAGTPFVHDHELYRPAQDCSRTYGGRIAVNRVLQLTIDDFSEETVKFIEPAIGSLYNKGMHTISAVGNYTLIDGKKYSFNFRFFFHQLRQKLTRKDSANV